LRCQEFALEAKNAEPTETFDATISSFVTNKSCLAEQELAVTQLGDDQGKRRMKKH
jgi:hypothetical protein